MTLPLSIPVSHKNEATVYNCACGISVPYILETLAVHFNTRLIELILDSKPLALLHSMNIKNKCKLILMWY